VPRGRYEADIYANLIRLRGKSYDYKIPYSSILKIFLLPRPDDVHVAMVIALDPPLRQGQTRYPFLIIQFSRDSEIDTTLSLSDDLKAQFEGKLQDSYEGPLYEIFSTILKTVADKRIIVPGSFKSVPLKPMKAIFICWSAAFFSFKNLLFSSHMKTSLPSLFLGKLLIPLLYFHASLPN
jgi:hypothetical protein